MMEISRLRSNSSVRSVSVPLPRLNIAILMWRAQHSENTYIFMYIQHNHRWLGKNVLDHDHRSIIMLKNTKVRHKLIKFCAILFYAVRVFGHTILSITYRKKINKTLMIKLLIYPGYERLVDRQASPAYEILYYLQATQLSRFNNCDMQFSCDRHNTCVRTGASANGIVRRFNWGKKMQKRNCKMSCASTVVS